MSGVKDSVQADIKGNDVMVFSKSYCPYCTRAKEALSSHGFAFKAIELDKVPDGAAIQAELQSLTNQRTVPNIFVKGKHLGGCDKTLEALSNGKFQQMLSA